MTNMIEREVKYQIFVSSTFKELSENRKIVIRTILQAGHMPVAIDNFTPKENRDREVINQTIQNCDFCILIIGSSYGEVINKGKSQIVSYTEYEYDKAIEFKKPVLAFILNEDEIRKELTQGTIVFEKYLKFINKVKKGSTPSYWSKSDLGNFTGLVAIAITDECQLLKDNNKDAGWVRAKNYKERELVGSAMNNEFYLETVKRLNQFEKLDKRCAVLSEQKKIAANYFNRLFLEKIIKEKINLFFESGSSIAYVAKEIGTRLKTKITIDDEGKPSLNIITNNILSYLELWLNNRIPCSFWPWGCPEEPYGASYGPISGFGIEENPDDPEPLYDLSPLNDKAKIAIENLRKLLYGPNFVNHEQKPLLMLGAISGVQFSENHKFVYEEGHAPNKEIENTIKKCMGFHVGSYKNKVFKRYLYNTSNPLIVFLNYDKINCPISVGKCHFIFDNEFTWNNFLNNYPLAFIVGCEKSNVDELKELFEKQLKYSTTTLSQTKSTTALLAKSKNFIY